MKANDLIIVEEHFNAPVEAVWNAISNLDTMIEWYFDNIPSFKPEVGFKSEFKVHSEERVFTHMWEVIEVEPLNKLVYSWVYPEYPGKSLIHFELFKENNTTLLRVTSEVLEDFPDHIPEFKNESCRDGWNYFIKNRLKNFLEKPE